MNRPQERGFTLTELVVVGALATIVMLGLVLFYISSQGTWMDASAQAITQREATGLIEQMRRNVHRSAGAIVTPRGANSQIDLLRYDGTPWYSYWWDETDSLVHEGRSTLSDSGACISSKVEIFRAVAETTMLDAFQIQVRSPEGQRMLLTSRMAFMNR